VLYKKAGWKKRNIVFMACENNPISRTSVEVSPVYLEVVGNEIKHLFDNGPNPEQVINGRKRQGC
jgi:hypothetical protein